MNLPKDNTPKSFFQDGTLDSGRFSSVSSFTETEVSPSSPTILPFDAPVADPRKTFKSRDTIALNFERTKAMKEYKETPQYVQFKTELDGRDTDYAIAVQQDYVLKHMEVKPEEKKTFLIPKKQSSIIFLMFVIIATSTGLILSVQGAQNVNEQVGEEDILINLGFDELDALCATRPNENRGSICLNETIFVKCSEGELETEAEDEIQFFSCSSLREDNPDIGNCLCEFGVVLADSSPCEGDIENDLDDCELAPE
eukprot:maker-scaffold_2-snap-gene-24.33-mRNA-1 protein AED:0.00 eAED:0.00 QI:102/1/1/1/1/1/2/69/254